MPIDDVTLYEGRVPGIYVALVRSMRQSRKDNEMRLKRDARNRRRRERYAEKKRQEQERKELSLWAAKNVLGLIDGFGFTHEIDDVEPKRGLGGHRWYKCKRCGGWVTGKDNSPCIVPSRPLPDIFTDWSLVAKLFKWLAKRGQWNLKIENVDGVKVGMHECIIGTVKDGTVEVKGKYGYLEILWRAAYKLSKRMQ